MPLTPSTLLLRMMDEAYEKKAWHGTNLRGSLRGVDAAQASWRPADGRHNIWELALHCAYWKYAVRRRLTGEKRGSFPRKGSNWFIIDAGSDEVWRADLDLLADAHRALREAIVALPDKQLSRKRASRYSGAQLIYGIVSHDLYHTGQIQLLKRLYRGEGEP